MCVCVCLDTVAMVIKTCKAAPGLQVKTDDVWRRTADTAGIAPDQSLDNMTSYDTTSGGSTLLSARHPILEYKKNTVE